MGNLSREEINEIFFFLIVTNRLELKIQTYFLLNIIRIFKKILKKKKMKKETIKLIKLVQAFLQQVLQPLISIVFILKIF